MKVVKVKKLDQQNKDFVTVLMSDSLVEEYGEPPTENTIEDLINYYYSRSDSSIFYIEKSRVFAGFIWLIQSMDVITGTPFCCVLYLAVKKEFRGKKYSKLLLEKAKEYCLENDIRELRLTVRYNNDPALNLYNNMGFKTYKHEMLLNLSDI